MYEMHQVGSCVCQLYYKGHFQVVQARLRAALDNCKILLHLDEAGIH